MLNISYVPEAVLGNGDTVVSKTDVTPVSVALMYQWEETENK